ncbi:MAG: DUF4410 domain-containing protein [Thiohalocapsa sp.]
MFALRGMNRCPTALTVILAILLLAATAACVPQPVTAPSAHPNPIIVREFTASPGVVTLDPSFGFSLYRGAPGVPARTRAASAARAAAFTLADAVASQLAGMGYDAVRSDTAEADSGGRALIVTGAFRQINEGHRRQHGSVAVDVEIDYQPGPGLPAQRLTAFTLDSRRIRPDPLVAAAARKGSGVNAAATAVGHAIANYAGDLARANNWPGAPR